jgi:hypothetical protein
VTGSEEERALTALAASTENKKKAVSFELDNNGGGERSFSFKLDNGAEASVAKHAIRSIHLHALPHARQLAASRARLDHSHDCVSARLKALPARSLTAHWTRRSSALTTHANVLVIPWETAFFCRH